MVSIADLILNSLKKRLDDKQIGFEITDKAKRKLVAIGYDPQFGARPLKRCIQGQVETLLAKTILAEDVAPGDKLTVDLDDNSNFTVNVN